MPIWPGYQVSRSWFHCSGSRSWVKAYSIILYYVRTLRICGGCAQHTPLAPKCPHCSHANAILPCPPPPLQQTHQPPPTHTSTPSPPPHTHTQAHTYQHAHPCTQPLPPHKSPIWWQCTSLLVLVGAKSQARTHTWKVGRSSKQFWFFGPQDRHQCLPPPPQNHQAVLVLWPARGPLGAHGVRYVRRSGVHVPAQTVRQVV